MGTHPLLTYQTGRSPVHIGLGRLITALGVAILLGLSVFSDRTEAKAKLNRLSEASYAAAYPTYRKALKASATHSDGYLVAVAIALLFMILMYEGTAWAIGWGLGYLDTLSERRAAVES
ncbi:MAG: hypothetical protein ABI587_10630 [Gemmatimonadales bacterium]